MYNKLAQETGLALMYAGLIGLTLVFLSGVAIPMFSYYLTKLTFWMAERIEKFWNDFYFADSATKVFKISLGMILLGFLIYGVTV